MNLFLLSWNLEECATHHINKHVGKMILEIVQMLYTAWHLSNPEEGWIDQCPLNKKGEHGYKKISNVNHPMAIWVRSSPYNYTFAARLALKLGEEFERRYGHPHASATHAKWLIEHVPKCTHQVSTKATYGSIGLNYGVEPVPLCMPEKYFDSDPVKAYNNYYQGEKITMAA